MTAKIKSKGYSIGVVEDFTNPLLISGPTTIPIGATLDLTVTTADIKNIVPSGIFNIQGVCKEKQFVFNQPNHQVPSNFYYEKGSDNVIHLNELL